MDTVDDLLLLKSSGYLSFASVNLLRVSKQTSITAMDLKIEDQIKKNHIECADMKYKHTKN